MNPLHGVVTQVWATTSRRSVPSEHLVPTGHLHLAWRLGAPVRIDDDQIEHHGVIGGVRTTAHRHDVVAGTRSIGVMLAPGATLRLFGHPARVFAGRHTGLDLLWGEAARGLVDALSSLHDDDAVAHLERFLIARLQPAPRPPGLRHALSRLEAGHALGDVARELGRSPRTVRDQVHDAVGCGPATWMRLRRLQRARRLAADRPWADVAHQAGYCDQAHLCRETRRITGVTPEQWRARGGSNHIADPSKTAPRTAG